MIASALTVAAALMLAVLAVDVISALPRRGAWWPFAFWAAVGLGAAFTGLLWRSVPPAVALLLLLVALPLWRQRRRIRWAAERGEPW